MMTLTKKRKITKVLLIIYILTLFVASATNVYAESLLDSDGVSSIDDLKEKANESANMVIWFLRLGGIVMLAVAFFQLYINPDKGKRAVIFAIIGTVGIVLAPQIVNGVGSFFG